MSNDPELEARYRSTYGLPAEVPPGTDEMWKHLELERELTRELLASTVERRWETFERCYNELYESLPWLRGTGGTPDRDRWLQLLGDASTVYEIGSGAGDLAAYLGSRGLKVKATDVSRERGGERKDSDCVSWGVTDGVHLDRFEAVGAYDAVISDQVIEHLHPDDLAEHFRSCRRILRRGGRYVFRTPHQITGPHDVSRIFGFSQPVGMHLREYTNEQLTEALMEAGFRRVSAVLRMPNTQTVVRSRLYLRLQIALERAVLWIGRPRARKLVGRLRGPLSLRVFLVAES